jgi:hypothetical protein
MNRTANLAALIAKGNVRKEVNKDKYGRTVTTYSISQYDEAAKTEANRTGFVASFHAVVVNMPKVYVEKTGLKYLVNDWSIQGRAGVTEHADRLEAHTTAVAAVIRASIK